MKLKTYFIVFVLIFCSSFSFAQQKKIIPADDSLQISKLERKVKELENGNQQTNNLVNVGIGSVANQLSSINLSIALFAVFITIVALALGIYFNRIESRLKDIESRTQQKLNDIEGIEARVNTIQFEINNNIHKIYKDLQNTEINYLLSLLEKEPLLMADFNSRLMSFEIGEQYFERFKNVYENFLTQYTPIVKFAPNDFSRFLWRFFWKKMILTGYSSPMLVTQKIKRKIIDFIIEYSKTSTIINVSKEIKKLLHSTDNYRVKELAVLLNIDEIQEVCELLNDWTGAKKAKPQEHAIQLRLLQEAINENPLDT